MPHYNGKDKFCLTHWSVFGVTSTLSIYLILVSIRAQTVGNNSLLLIYSKTQSCLKLTMQIRKLWVLQMSQRVKTFEVEYRLLLCTKCKLSSKT